MANIGFDLDGVLADQTQFKVSKFRELFGLNLERWQVSSNVIDIYVPDRTVRREIGALSGKNTHHTFVEPETIRYLEELTRLKHQLYLISRRGKSPEGMRAGQETLEALGLKRFFGNNLKFCQTEEEKIQRIVEVGCSAFVDDRVETVNALAERLAHPILYDPFGLVKSGHVKPYTKVLTINTLSSVREIV